MPIRAASESASSVPASAALGLRSAPIVPPSSALEQLRQFNFRLFPSGKVIWVIENARRLKFGCDCLPLSGRR